jgi:type IV pilus assembly protein PilA
MNRKGFTLIEILAVVAILAILAITLLPNVLSVFNTSKRSTFRNEILAIYTKAQSQYVMDTSKKKTVVAYANIDGYDCANELDLNGRDSINYYIEYDENGNIVRFIAYDEDFQYQLEGRKIKKTDIKDAEDYNNLDLSEFVNPEACTPHSNNGGGNNGGGGGTVTTAYAKLAGGLFVNAKIKSVARELNELIDAGENDTLIKKIKRSNVLPEDFVPTDMNTISTSNSKIPVYIYWDSSTGTIYYYTTADKIILSDEFQRIIFNFSINTNWRLEVFWKFNVI